MDNCVGIPDLKARLVGVLCFAQLNEVLHGLRADVIEQLEHNTLGELPSYLDIHVGVLQVLRPFGDQPNVLIQCEPSVDLDLAVVGVAIFE